MIPAPPPEGFQQELVDPQNAFNPMTGGRAVWNEETRAWLDPRSKMPAGYERHPYDPSEALDPWTGRGARIDHRSGHWIDVRSGLPLYPAALPDPAPAAPEPEPAVAEPAVAVAAEPPRSGRALRECLSELAQLVDELEAAELIAS